MNRRIVFPSLGVFVMTAVDDGYKGVCQCVNGDERIMLVCVQSSAFVQEGVHDI